MGAGETDRIHHERREADRRYNEALTALDRAIVGAGGRALVREDFERLATALIVFLQQITGFVEASDREVVCDLGARLAAWEQRFGLLDELSARMSIVQRSLEALRRELATQAARNAPAGSQPGRADELARPGHRSAIDSGESADGHQQSPLSDSMYIAFEDQFRGTDESVHARVREYVPIFHGATDVVDLGCGRGEFLAALADAGIAARGVDANAGMVAVVRERGLSAVTGDALTYAASVPDESLGGVVAIQVIEHLEPSYLMRLLDTAGRKMRRGAPIVLETINPACWFAFFSSYIRDFTHIRPVHPETLQYLLRASGFERVQIRYSAPVPDQIKMRTVELPAGVLSSSEPHAMAVTRLAHTLNANATVLNNLMFTHLDYAAVAYRT
jgi:SAM-dependent methyltransferase